MDVSENSGTPKSSILIGFSIINHPFWGTPVFGNTLIALTLLPAHCRVLRKLLHSWQLSVLWHVIPWLDVEGPKVRCTGFRLNLYNFRHFGGGRSFGKCHSMSMFGFFLPPPQGNRWCEATTAGWTAFQQDECQFCPKISGRPVLKSWMCNAFSGVMGLACDVYPKCDRWLLAPKNYGFFLDSKLQSPYFRRNPLAVEVSERDPTSHKLMCEEREQRSKHWKKRETSWSFGRSSGAGGITSFREFQPHAVQSVSS